MQGASRGALADTQDTQSLQAQAGTVAPDEKSTWVPFTQSVLGKIREARRGYTPIQNEKDEIQGESPHIVTCECGSSTDERNLVSGPNLISMIDLLKKLDSVQSL